MASEALRRGWTRKYHKGRARIDALKAVPCTDCGGRFPPECMDFDHVRGEKLASISRLAAKSMLRIEAELAKCDMVCSNCHRIRTAARLRGG